MGNKMKDKFIILERKVIENSRISLKAKGLYCVIKANGNIDLGSFTEEELVAYEELDKFDVFDFYSDDILSD